MIAEVCAIASRGSRSAETRLNALLLGGFAATTIGVRYLGARTRRVRLERARALYESYTGASGTPDEDVRALLERDAAVVARTIRSAPVDPSRLSFFDGTDRYPFFADGDVGVLENFLAPRAVIRREYLAAIDVAIRHYRGLERDAIDPRTWLRWVLFLPRDWLEYLGLRSARSRWLMTAIQLAYWAVPLALAGSWAWKRFELGRYLPG